MYFLNKRKCNIPGNLFLWQSDCPYFAPISTALRAAAVSGNLYWCSAHRKRTHNLIKWLIINLVSIAITCHIHTRCTNVHPNALMHLHSTNEIFSSGQRTVFCFTLLQHILCPSVRTGQLKCDGTRAETTFSLSAKRTSPFKSARGSVQSNTGSRGVRISGSNAGYTMFRGSVKDTGYPLHSQVSPSLPLPCVTVCHHISAGV